MFVNIYSIEGYLVLSKPAQMAPIDLHLEYAKQDDEAAAKELFQEWCLNPDPFMGTGSWDMPQYEVSYRPTCEPPIFDYEDFIEENVPSPLQLEKIFPGDPVLKTAWRDVVTERKLLQQYHDWCNSNVGHDHKRKWDVHLPLRAEVFKDMMTLEDEMQDMSVLLPTEGLGIWEYTYLDGDGKTTKMEEAMRKGEDIFSRFGDAGIKEYAHVAPPGYFKAIRMMRLLRWECYTLDNAGGDNTFLRWMIEDKVDLFNPGVDLGGVARARYAHLIPRGWEAEISLEDWFEHHKEHCKDLLERDFELFLKERCIAMVEAERMSTEAMSELTLRSTAPSTPQRPALTTLLGFRISTEDAWSKGRHAHLGLRLSAISGLSPVKVRSEQELVD